ncbi:MAG: hypothetical protein R3F48_10845 [Candidatus Zixiibacteriota bacterium]
MSQQSLQEIDRRQLRALIRNNLKLDWRGAINPMSSYNQRASKIPGMVAVLGMNIFMSLFIGTIFIRVADLFSGLVLTATIAMAAISMQVMLEFGNTLISPDDYNVIAPHPVTSRTFFVAKLLHTILYVSILSLSISFAPMIFAIIKFRSIIAAPAILIHFWICNVFAAVFMMNLYTLVLKKIDRRTLERWLGYIHMALMLGTYLLINVLPRWMRDLQTAIDIKDYSWAKILPSYWFGSLLRLATGDIALESILFSVCGLLLLYVLGRIAVSYLSLSYAESLTRTGWDKDVTRTKHSNSFIARLWRRMSNDEDRALLRLIKANFKHDIQFRLGVMSMVPLIIFYVIFSIIAEGTNVRDPFTILDHSQVMTNMMLGISCIIAPYALIGALQTSKQWQAAWVYYAAPLNRVNLVLAIEKISNILIVLPMSLLLTIALSILYGNILHAVLQTIALIVVAQTALTLINVYSIRLPFAMDNTGSNWAGSVMGPMFLGMIVFGVPLMITGAKGYGGYIGWAAYVAVFIVVRWLLRRGQRRRIEKAMVKWEFGG